MPASHPHPHGWGLPGGEVKFCYGVSHDLPLQKYKMPVHHGHQKRNNKELMIVIPKTAYPRSFPNQTRAAQYNEQSCSGWYDQPTTPLRSKALPLQAASCKSMTQCMGTDPSKPRPASIFLNYPLDGAALQPTALLAKKQRPFLVTTLLQPI